MHDRHVANTYIHGQIHQRMYVRIDKLAGNGSGLFCVSSLQPEMVSECGNEMITWDPFGWKPSPQVKITGRYKNDLSPSLTYIMMHGCMIPQRGAPRPQILPDECPGTSYRECK